MTAYRFGAFELDDRAGTLSRSGRRVHLAPQPAAILTALVQRPGELVTREDLRAALWDGGTFVDFDKGLNFAVSRLRVALGDNARAPRFVETVPRRGYRFVAPVERIAEAPAAPAPVVQPPRSRHPRGWGVAAAAVLAALVLGDPSDRRLRHERALAHLDVAERYASLGEDGHLPAHEAFPAAARAAQQALALEDSPAAWAVVAKVRFLYEWDWPGARDAFDRATQGDAAACGVGQLYARFLSASGDHQRALDVLRGAAGRDAATLLHEEGWIHYRARRYAEAKRAFVESAAAGPAGGGPESWGAWNRFLVLLVNHHRGATAEAAEDALAIMRHNGAPADHVESAARAPARMFVPRFLRGSIRWTRSAAERRPIPPTQIAMLHAAVGEDDAALDLLTLAARDRAPALAYSLGDPLFDRLRPLPRFRSLVRRVAPHLLPSTSGEGWVVVADASSAR
jgi:DNA-binding winged helix-turn-helix (wHTH) protein